MDSDNAHTEKQWQLVALRVMRDAEEFAGLMLFDLGTTGIITLAEHADSLELGAYFDQQTDAEMIARLLEIEFTRAGLRASLLGVSISALPDQDWMQKWKEGFAPTTIGQRLIVAPSWRLPEETDGRIVIQIDPGMAFGTGTHETTRMCLEAINARWRGGRLLDVGTGTGILAIAAALLAPETRVTAIDIDPQAIEVARENIEINHALDAIDLAVAPPRDYVGRAFDAVVANLTAEVILDLFGDLVGCLAPTGEMILSGILTVLADDVARAVVAAGLTVVERRAMGEWSVIVAARGEA